MLQNITEYFMHETVQNTEDRMTYSRNVTECRGSNNEMLRNDLENQIS